MGYISSASTVYMDFNLTDAGRTAMVTGDLSQAITKFALSDGDIDYRQPTSTGHTVVAQGGFLTDVTGTHNSCSGAITAGYQQNPDAMLQMDVQAAINTGGGTPTGTISTPQVVVGYTNDITNQMEYYSSLEVEVYLHDYLVLQKHLMQAFPDAHQLLYEYQSGGTITPQIWKDAFLNGFVQLSGQTFNASHLKQALNLIQSSPGRGQFLDFYDEVKIKDGASFLDDNFRVSATTDSLMNNILNLSQRQMIFDTGSMGTDSGSGPGQLDVVKPVRLATQDGLSSSSEYLQNHPYQLSFSNKGAQYHGNGPAGLGLSSQGFGYLVLPQQNSFAASTLNTSARYPDWQNATFNTNVDYQNATGTQDFATYALGFVSPWLLENFNTGGGPLTLTNNAMMGANSVSASYMNPVDPVGTNGVQAGTYDSVEYIIPTIRTRKQLNEYNGINYYYPIPTPYLDGSIDISYGDAQMDVPTTFIGDNIYMRLLSPGNYLSSWGVIMGNLEYVDMGVTQQNIYGQVDITPSVFAPPQSTNTTNIQNGGRYYNFLSRALLNTDKMLAQMQSTSTVGNANVNNTQMTEITQGSNATGGTYYSGFTSTSNGVDDRYIMTIPLNFKVFSQSNPNALPASVNVKVVYSKEAVQQSIGYSSDTTSAGFNTVAPASNGGSYWRPWDNIETKYYGERWSKLSTGAATNADFTTDPSNSTMDVANGTSTGYRIFRNKIGGSPVM